MGSFLNPLIRPFESLSPGWAGIISPFIVNTLIFFVAQLKKDNSIVDIGWSWLFMVPNMLATLKTHGTDIS